jgi:hypothetical protein
VIRRHDFDSEWRGRPVGIVDDPALFTYPSDQVGRLCEPFEWVEFRDDATNPTEAASLLARGFAKLDTHIQFRLDLEALAPAPVPGLRATTAAESSFDPDLSIAHPFKNERFVSLPGVDQAAINERYTLWARALCDEAPSWCVAVGKDDTLQGWFFSRQIEPGHINLTLGVACAHSQISGKDLFRSAFARYLEAGATVGSATFSVKSLAVMNIYSSFGARFTGATDFWLRSPSWDPNTHE